MSETFIRTDGSQGVRVNVYNGKYSLNAAYEGKDGKVNLSWAKKQTGRDQFAEKATPISISLGDKETAKGVLRMLFKEIDGGATTQAQKPPAEKKPDPPPAATEYQDDVPF